MSLVAISLIALQAPADDIADLIDTYAAQHLNGGDIVVGISHAGASTWYSTGDLSPMTPVQIGSVTKGLMGMLVAAQISAGVISETTTVGDLWPREDGIPSPPGRLGSIPLTALATHTSGLPRVGLQLPDIARALVSPDNPYRGIDREAVLRQATEATLTEVGSFSYSNLGYAILGVLLADRKADTAPFPRRLEDSLSAWVTVPLTGHPAVLTNPPELAQGYASNGRRAEPWAFGAYAGAGAAVMSAATLSSIANSLIGLPTPLRGAIEPRIAVRDGLDVGLGWFIEDIGADRQMVWHNGSTGTFASFVAAVPAENTSIVVVTNTAVPVDALGRALLLDHEPPARPSPPTLFVHLMAWLLIIAVVGYPLRILIAERNLMPRLFQARNALLPVIETGVGLVFGIAIWSRISPGYLYASWARVALLFVVALCVAIEASRQVPRHSTLSRRSQFASIARVTLFAALTIVYW